MIKVRTRLIKNDVLSEPGLDEKVESILSEYPGSYYETVSLSYGTRRAKEFGLFMESYVFLLKTEEDRLRFSLEWNDLILNKDQITPIFNIDRSTI